jgi:hypothetical protein
MATIQRPVKTYGTRSYVAEVAAAPGNLDPVLSNEVDADLDTIYAAWNGGVDTVNVKDGSITFAKLAADAQLWRDTGTTITPGTNFAARSVAVPGTNAGAVQWGTQTAKARLMFHPTVITSYWTHNAYLNAGATAWVQDDPTKSSWMAAFDNADVFRVRRSPVGSVTFSDLLSLDAGGYLTLQSALETACTIRLVAANGSSSQLAGRSSRGTLAAATATLYQDIFCQVVAEGCYAANSFSQNAFIRFTAAENWTSAARGTNCIIYTTTIGTTAPGPNMLFDSNGNLTITGNIGQKASGTTWQNPSDRRLKDEIEDYATGLAAIVQLQPRTFVYNGKGGSPAGLRGYGFIADEIAPVMPETVAVRAGKLDAADEDETDIQTLDQSNLILALVNAVKELATRVATLEGAAA